jgi:hypothetical protein
MWDELGITPDAGSRPVLDRRSPEERLEALVNESSVDAARAMIGEIRIDARADFSGWLSAARTLEARGVMSLSAVCYLAEILLEDTGFDPVESDAELCRLTQELEAMERADGLGTDEFWVKGEEPPEWIACNAAWEARMEVLIVECLRGAGQNDLAELRERDVEGFQEMVSVGWTELLGDE